MAATETTARSRVALLRRTLDGHNEKLADLDGALAAMPERQRDARLAAIEKAPTKRSDPLGSEVQKLRDEERKLTVARENLLDEIEAAKVALDRAVEAGRDELRDSFREKAADFDTREREAWIALAGKFEEFVGVYNAVLDVVEERESYVTSIEWQNNTDRIELEPMFRPWQQPFPIDALRAFEMAVDASADPKGWGVHSGGVVGGGIGHLPEVMPDLRAVYRYGKLIRGDKTASTRDAMEGRGLVGSFSAPMPARGT